MGKTLQKHAGLRRQDTNFVDWFLDLRELAGDRWYDVADQAPTAFAIWAGGATVPQALYMITTILPPRTT
ncbi:MAG: hypothetical protein L0Z50_33680 [Verrucomicrobiales bacterium]|nr:hypothetical protein [Verrucomicrobiales bacterium]